MQLLFSVMGGGKAAYGKCRLPSWGMQMRGRRLKPNLKPNLGLEALLLCAGAGLCVYAVKGAGSGYCAQLKMGDAERQSVTRFL